MSDMFASVDFQGVISKWDVSRVTDMNGMFTGAIRFNGDISKWDVSSLLDMMHMFMSARAFQGDVSKWDVSSVHDMSGAFADTTVFNSDLSKWDVSRVTDMTGLFYKALSFNGDIAKWDVSTVADMGAMFMGAAVFNGDIVHWEVSSVTNMDYMFNLAASFNRQLCGAAWVYSPATRKDMFVGSLGSIAMSPCLEEQSQRWLARWRVASTSIAVLLATPGVSSVFIICTKCGIFKMSGRVSCCAPGGAWYKKCGGEGNTNVGHSWLEGVEACEG